MNHPAGRLLILKCAAWAHHLPWFCLCLLLSAGVATAQELKQGAGHYTLPSGSMPAWTVPVLKLVSSNYVEPTTGIVISETGLVLVPEDFASIGDEIIVLDGGTDIIRNGRPARIEHKFSADGLQVLFVEGLKRRGVTLAAADPAAGSEVVLVAFPPAEQIAQGEPPLSIGTTVEQVTETGEPVFSAEAKLPNVTGGLVDACGSLVGVSLADDVQSMEPSPSTGYQWRKELLRILDELNIEPSLFDCNGQSTIAAADSVEEETPSAEPAPVESAPAPAGIEEEPLPEEAIPTDQAPENETEAENRQETAEKERPVIVLPPIETGTDGALENRENQTARKWPWLIAALVLFVLGLLTHRIRQSRQRLAGSASNTQRTATPAGANDDEVVDVALELPDSLLLIRGVFPDGEPFEDSIPVSEQAINVTIGRGDADLRIDSPAVSRRHANLNGTSAELTVSDLGSSNGTSVNGVPCLEGEILFITPGDTLVLGNAKCTLEIKPRNGQGSSRS